MPPITPNSTRASRVRNNAALPSSKELEREIMSVTRPTNMGIAKLDRDEMRRKIQPTPWAHRSGLSSVIRRRRVDPASGKGCCCFSSTKAPLSMSSLLVPLPFRRGSFSESGPGPVCDFFLLEEWFTMRACRLKTKPSATTMAIEYISMTSPILFKPSPSAVEVLVKYSLSERRAPLTAQITSTYTNDPTDTFFGRAKKGGSKREDRIRERASISGVLLEAE
mmetsp:Transcript_1917/g.2908  ORF Transcript_1917/g.2908 Transcript_1917/m.2908 type:complete len:222 (+) Transcript_1917:2167-2832(+)